MELEAAFEMAEGLVRTHGLAGWQVEFDTAKRRAGVCRFSDRVIGLSAPLTRLHSEDEVRDTILHEIAHALVGPTHGHDAVWRRTAVAIGCSGKRCLDTESPRVIGGWIGICSAGHTKDRYRRPERVLSCSQCSPTFSLDHVFDWTYRGRPAPMHPNYLAELDAIRAGRRVRLAPVGGRVRVTLPGEYDGVVGRVVKIGRTSYHVRVPGTGTLRVVFAGAEPVR
jgi:predicted SprT family Zn-dependent metalloprotease